MSDPLDAAGPAVGRAGEAGQPSRHEMLASATSGIRVRGTKIPVEQILLVSACVLFPLGLVFIFLGWYGAAHTGRTYAQIDYLISGGLMGVGVSVAGGFMYFGYWLSRQLREARRQNGLTLQALNRIQETLAGQTATGTAPWSPPATWAPPQTASETRSANGSRSRAKKPAAADAPTGEVPLPQLVATAKGSLLHQPDCPVVAGKQGLKAIPAGMEGYGYCTMCDAAGAVAASPPPIAPGG